MRHRAFSLIEVMAAAAIFGAGLAAVFTAFSMSAQQFEHQRHTSHAIHLTEARMEELLLRLSSDSELVVGPTYGPLWFDARGFPSSGCPNTLSDPPIGTETCRYRVTWQTSTGGIPQVRVVTVTTSWNERGATRSVSFSTQRN